MEYNSFYGGRRGASFVIVKKYRCIKTPAEDNLGFNKIIRIDLGLAEDAEITAKNRNDWLAEHCMTYCFSQGGNYKTVNYDEYVIIDTYNNNDIDNGKIYRRGYEYNNEMGGAVYIGQIVGPAGMAPHTELEEYDKIKNMVTEDGLVIPNDGTTVTDGNLNQYRKTQATLDTATKDLLPGHYYDEDGNDNFHDTIEYIACSIRDFDSHESTVHIGFKIPYHVSRYTAESVSPYYHRTDDKKYQQGEVGKGKPWEGWSETGDTTNFKNAELIQRTDDETHPFFSQWHFSIPKGVHGNDLKEFRVTTVAAELEKHPNWLQQYEGIDDDKVTEPIKKERKILVYDYYNYDRDVGGDPVTLFLGDYNQISNFTIDDYGTVTIDYSHDDEDIYPNLFKWIKEIRLNKETGLFEIEYNYDKTRDGEELAKEDTKFTMSLTWVKDMTIDKYGTIHFIYTDQEDTIYKNFMKWINDISLDVETGLFTINYNYDKTRDGEELAGVDTQYQTYLRFVKNIRIDEDGTIHFDYTHGEEQTFERYIKTIKSITLDGETGHFTIIYNQETDKDGNPTKYDTDLRWVNNIQLSENGTITLKYTTGNDVVLDKKIKWIKQTELANDGTLTITYNDNTTDVFNKAIKWIDNISLTDEGIFTIVYNNGLPNFTKTLKWPTSIKINTGDTEGEGNQKLNIIYNDGTSEEIGNPINYIMKTAINDEYHLLALYSDPERRAAGPNVSYNGRDDWTDLGYIGNGGQVGCVAGKASNEAVVAIANSMPPYSTWIIVEEDS